MALRDSFVNIAKNAAASAASGFVSGVAGGHRTDRLAHFHPRPLTGSRQGTGPGSRLSL